MHHHHVLDLPEITTLLVAYLSPYDILSCLRVCSFWRRSLEHELWRRTIINPLPPPCTKKDTPNNDSEKPSIALIASKAAPSASQLPSCRYCLPPRAPSAGGSLSRRHQATHLHDHRANGLEITRRLDPTLIKSKGHLIQSLEGLDLQTPLLTAVAVHCLHLRHLELVIKPRPEPPQAPSLMDRIRPTPLWSVKEDSLAVETFMRAVARVGEFRALAESNNAGEEGFVLRAPRVGYAMELESVCVVLEDTKCDFRLLWSLRHLPNLRRLKVQGPGQWINRMVNAEPDRMVFFLEDLVVLLEQCQGIEELVLSSLQLVDGATADGSIRDRSKGNRFRKILEAPVVLSTPLWSSSSSSQETSSSPAQQYQHHSQNHTPSSLGSLALPILPHHTSVYLHLLQSTLVGPHLHSLDLSFVEWNCHLPSSTASIASLLLACPCLRALTLRFKPDPPRETVLQDLGEILTKDRFRRAHLYTSDYAHNDDVGLHRMLTSRLNSWIHTLGHGPPATYSCLDLAELAKAFPRTLTSLSLIDVQINDANLLAIDPEHVSAVTGITHLHVRYRPCVCPVEVLEKILGVFRGLTWLEMGASRLQGCGHNNKNNNNDTSRTGGAPPPGQQGQGQGGGGGETSGSSLRDRQLVEAMEGSAWACQHTLRHLDICQMDVYLYPAYCERLMGRIQTDLQGLRDLRVDLRCFRVRQQQKMKKRVGRPSGATGTCRGIHTTFAEEEEDEEESVKVENVDMTLPLDIEWSQLDRLYVHGARQFSPGDWGMATVGWFESLRADEMRWIREEVLNRRATFLYCHFGEWREIKRVCE